MLQKEFNFFDKFIRYLRLKKILPYIDKNKIVCDLGCGDGTILKTISERIKEGYGLDVKMASSDKTNLHFIEADIAKPLPLESDKFDAVFLLAVLEHLESPDIILNEIRRILKPDGKLVLTTPSPRSRPLLEFLAFKLKLISRDEIMDHKHYYSKKELNDLLIKFGFKILKIKTFEFGLNLLAVAEK